MPGPIASPENEEHRSAVIGNASNFWLFFSKTGFDLSHPPTPSSPPIEPRVTLETSTLPVTIDPAKTALVIIDMQNFFLSPALGRQRGNGHVALDNLVEHAIPAARKAGIRIIWLNWGLSEEELEEMPPAIKRAFGFEAAVDEKKDEEGAKEKVLQDIKNGKIYKGLGSEMGFVKDPVSGEEIDAGRMLMRDTWNTALPSPLDKIYAEGSKMESRPDVWIHKNRTSGMSATGSACEQFLESEGIKTLFFTGVNTDQCVGGTYQDCFSKGYDCILLSDGCGTTSPDFAQKCIEFNAANTWGFMATCKQLAGGVGM